MNPDLERLARHEHDQWVHWTAYMLDNLTPENIARWRRQIATPYEQLSEDEKRSDRDWAKRFLRELREPSDAMRRHQYKGPIVSWQATIDHLLSEGESDGPER